MSDIMILSRRDNNCAAVVVNVRTYVKDAGRVRTRHVGRVTASFGLYILVLVLGWSGKGSSRDLL